MTPDTHPDLGPWFIIDGNSSCLREYLGPTASERGPLNNRPLGRFVWDDPAAAPGSRTVEFYWWQLGDEDLSDPAALPSWALVPYHVAVVLRVRLGYEMYTAQGELT